MNIRPLQKSSNPFFEEHESLRMGFMGRWRLRIVSLFTPDLRKAAKNLSRCKSLYRRSSPYQYSDRSAQRVAGCVINLALKEVGNGSFPSGPLHTKIIKTRISQILSVANLDYSKAALTQLKSAINTELAAFATLKKRPKEPLLRVSRKASPQVMSQEQRFAQTKTALQDCANSVMVLGADRGDEFLRQVDQIISPFIDQNGDGSRVRIKLEKALRMDLILLILPEKQIVIQDVQTFSAWVKTFSDLQKDLDLCIQQVDPKVCGLKEMERLWNQLVTRRRECLLKANEMLIQFKEKYPSVNEKFVGALFGPIDQKMDLLQKQLKAPSPKGKKDLPSSDMRFRTYFPNPTLMM